MAAEKKEKKPAKEPKAKAEKKQKAGKRQQEPLEKAGAKPVEKAQEPAGETARKAEEHRAKKAGAARSKKTGQARKRSGKKREAWVDYRPEDVEKLVINFGKVGQSAAEIGMALRDQYAVPSVKAITGKRIEKIMESANIKSDMPRDILNLIRKSVTLMKHMDKNRKDMSAKRGYQLTVSKIRRLSKYYIKKGRIPSDWRYSPEAAVLLVK